MSIFSRNKVDYTEASQSLGKRVLRSASELLQVALIVTAIVLPIRQVDKGYVRPPITHQHFVPEKY